MLTFSQLPNTTTGQLEILNYVHMFLRVITIAEMATERGYIVPSHRLNGKWCATSNLQWPDIPPPPTSAFNLFRNKIHQAYAGHSSSGRRCQNAVMLKTHLGPWLYTPQHIQHEHESYITTDALYMCSSEDTHLFKVYTTSTSKLFELQLLPTPLPPHAIPTIWHTRFHCLDE